MVISKLSVLALLAVLPLSWSATPLPEKTLRPRSIVPLDQLVAATRDRFASTIVIRSARLTQEDGRKVYVIDFTDGGNKWLRVVYDAFSGQRVEHVPMQMPIPLEDILGRVSSQYPKSRRIKTELQRQDGNLVYVVELAHQQIMSKRRQLTMDAYTGRLLKVESYDLKPEGKQVALEQIIKNAREKYHGMVVLRTQSRVKDNTLIREIVFLDDQRIRHKMLVNATTGEVLEDKITPLGIR